MILPVAQLKAGEKTYLLQILLEPLQRLQERALLRESRLLVLHIPPHREPMLHPTIQINLVRRLHLLQNLLRLLPLLLREDEIRLRRADRERPAHVAELRLIHEARVRAVPDVDFVLRGEEVAHDVFRAEAVADGADFREGVLGAHLDEAGVDDGVDLGREMGLPTLVIRAFHPGLDVEVARAVKGDGIAGEEVGHQDEVAVGGELVGDELRVDEGVADYVGDDEDTSGGFFFGVGDVGFDCRGVVR